MERDYFEEIDTLVKKGLVKEAENKLKMFSEQVNSNPSYTGYYWRAKAYDCIDPKKHASKILEDINSASAKEFIEQLLQKEIPVPALLLKAKVCYYLGKYELGIVTIDEILKRKQKQVGKAELAEAYHYSAIIKFKLYKDEEFWMNDAKKASSLGHKTASVFIHNIKFKKKKDKR